MHPLKIKVYGKNAFNKNIPAFAKEGDCAEIYAS